MALSSGYFFSQLSESQDVKILPYLPIEKSVNDSSIFPGKLIYFFQTLM